MCSSDLDLFGFYGFGHQPSTSTLSAWNRLVAVARQGLEATSPVSPVLTAVEPFRSMFAETPLGSSGRIASTDWLRGAVPDDLVPPINGEPFVGVSIQGPQQARRFLKRRLSDKEKPAEPLVQSSSGISETVAGIATSSYLEVIYDQDADRLTCARSRGESLPLYYFLQDRVLWFGTRLAPLRRIPQFPAGIDYEAVSFLLAYGFPPLGRPLFRGVKRLQSGTVVQFTSDRIDVGDIEPIVPQGRHATAAKLSSNRSLEDAVIDALGEHLAGQRVALLGSIGDPRTQWLESVVARAGASQIVLPEQRVEHRLKEPDSALALLGRLIDEDGELYTSPALVELAEEALAVAGNADLCVSPLGSTTLFAAARRHLRFRDSVAQSNVRIRRGEPSQTSQAGVVFARDFYFRQIAVLDDEARSVMAGPLLAQWNLFSMADELGLQLEAATPDTANELACAVDRTFIVEGSLRPMVRAVARSAGLPILTPFMAESVQGAVDSMPREDRASLVDSLESWPLEETLARGLMEGLWRGNERSVRMLLESPSFFARGLIGRVALTNLLDRHFGGGSEDGNLIWAMCGLELWFRSFVDYRR